MDLFSTDLGIWLSFGISGGEGYEAPKPHPPLGTPLPTRPLSRQMNIKVITMRSEFIGWKHEHGPQNIHTD
jgi:hypothetical protein